jgi:hypothetical protein
MRRGLCNKRVARPPHSGKPMITPLRVLPNVAQS